MITFRNKLDTNHISSCEMSPVSGISSPFLKEYTKVSVGIAHLDLSEDDTEDG